jgi:fructose-1,6-bisphosphatase
MAGIGQSFVWSLAPRKILTAISFQLLKMDTSAQFTKTESKRSKTQPWIVATMKVLIKRAAVSWIASQVTKSKMRKALSESLALFAFFIERREFSG